MVKRTCTVDDCDNPVYAKGLCNKHYLRLRRNGDPIVKSLRPTICSIPDCGRKIAGKGLCDKHYQRLRSHGDPYNHGNLRGQELDYKFRYHAPGPFGDECVEWPVGRDQDGYGILQHRRKTVRAHRLSYELHHGPIKSTDIIRHTCDNPPCVNPNHLMKGSTADNVNDKISRGRMKVGSQIRSSKLTEKDVLEIRKIGRSLPQWMIAERFGIARRTVSHVLNRDHWKHI